MSCLVFVAVLLIMLSLQLYCQAHEFQPHVCIIGAGISGASASHFLTVHFSSKKITVFEKNNKPGGRIATLRLKHIPNIEAGASIIAEDNSLMAYFAEFLNLTQVADGESSETIGLWNGNSFVFRTQPSRFRTLLALLIRYRLSLFRMKLFVKRLLKLFSNVYPGGGAGNTWKGYKTVSDLLARASPLYQQTQRNFAELIHDRFSATFTDEIVSAIIRVNYGQDVEQINGMAGSVGLAGSGRGLWSIAEGNEQIVFGLLKYAGVDLHLETRITQIDRQGVGYILKNGTSQWFCDAVVMAAPVELAEVKLPTELGDDLKVNRTFQKTVTTFVHGNLSKETFGKSPPDAILTTANVQDVFTSVAKKATLADTKVFKVFSKVALDKAALKRMFDPSAEVLAEFPWLAYPKYAIPELFAKFDVDSKGIFIYTSPLESAGSAMEMSAIAGANAAALIIEKLGLTSIEMPVSKEEL